MFSQRNHDFLSMIQFHLYQDGFLKHIMPKGMVWNVCLFNNSARPYGKGA